MTSLAGRGCFRHVLRRPPDLENPFRSWNECLADWRPIHRSTADLTRLCADAGVALTMCRSKPTRLVSPSSLVAGSACPRPQPSNRRSK